MKLPAFIKDHNGLWVIFGAIFFFFFILDWILYFTTQFTKTVTIAQKYVAGGRSTKYVLIDSDNNVYYMTTSVLDGRMDTVQQYATTAIGKKYVIQGYGIHFPSLNYYQKVFRIGPA